MILSRKTKLYLVLSFLFGFVAGGLALNLFTTQAKARDPGKWKGWDRKNHQKNDYGVSHLTNLLDLDEAQAEKIRAIMKEHFSEFGRIMKSVSPQTWELHERTVAAVKAELTAEQQEIYDEFITRFEKGMKKWAAEQEKQHADAP